MSVWDELQQCRDDGAKPMAIADRAIARGRALERVAEYRRVIAYGLEILKRRVDVDSDVQHCAAEALSALAELDRLTGGG